jgi:hypothetical protein
MRIELKDVSRYEDLENSYEVATLVEPRSAGAAEREVIFQRVKTALTDHEAQPRTQSQRWCFTA